MDCQSISIRFHKNRAEEPAPLNPKRHLHQPPQTTRSFDFPKYMPPQNLNGPLPPLYKIDAIVIPMNSPKKNRGRKKLFKCFRPVDGDDDGSVRPGRTDGSRDQVFKYISVEGEEERMVLPKILTSLSEEKVRVSSDGGDAGGGGRRNKERSGRCFYGIFKAILFETSLAKKARRRKARENSNSSNSKIASAEIKEDSTKSVNEKPTQREYSDSDDRRINSSGSSSLNSSFSTIASSTTSMSSSCASSVTTSTSSSERKGSLPFGASSIKSKQGDRPKIPNPTTKAKGYYYSSHIGLCLLLVCLLVLILWGKAYAVLCTSTCFFLVPSRVRRVDSPGRGVDSPEIDSQEYKKRVIMEGLLQRNRSRVN